jgi:mannose-6-phosphate isomerase-like protein (cupin superfamily)
VKSKLMGLLLVLPLLTLHVTGAEPAGYKYWSAAELKSMSKPLSNKNDAKTSLENLAGFGATDRAVMVHRDGSGVAEQHETEADLMVIVSGRGELIVGGAMRDGKSTAEGELRGPSIDGGVHQKLSPGDILHIPPKVPHQVLVDGAQITYFVLKVKE